MFKNGFIILMVLLLSLTSCSSSKINLAEAKEVEAQNYSLKDEVNDSLIHIIRDGGFVGRGVAVKVKVNDKFIANLPAGHKVSIYLPQASHEFEAVGASFIGESKAKESFVIDALESELRLMFPGDNTIKLIKVDK